MINNLKRIYDDYVSNNFINSDKKQLKILEYFEQIWNQNQKLNFLSKSKKIKGIYLHGPSGSGKTFLINLFINNILKSKKYHFNHFMINLHAFIDNHTKKNIALENYINIIAKKYKVVFIDELHIFNIVDALLVKKIFSNFKKNKVFVLVSSNFKPQDLYKNGLQRDDFIPFISYLEENFKIMQLNNHKDYRRQMLNQSKTYFTPINDQTYDEFKKLFNRFVDKGSIFIKKIQSKSRLIRLEKCTTNIAFCSFDELCKTNLGHTDYINLAKSFRLFFISKVPKFTESESDQCRRFISLIDMLYNEGCSVVILAAKPINRLCAINTLNKEFLRTASRLYEMTIINPSKK